MDKFIKSAAKPIKKVLATSSPKLKAFACVLLIMVVSELYLNNEAVSQLMDTNSEAMGLDAMRSLIIALFLTVILVAFNLYGGDRAKRFYAAITKGEEKPDISMLVIAVASPVLSLILTLVISYIRFAVGSGAGQGADGLAAALEAAGGVASTSSNFSLPEVILLASVLIAAVAFSYMYSFVTTDPDDMAKNAEVVMAEEGIRATIAKGEFDRGDAFVLDSLALCDDLGDGVRARAKDKVLISLLELCHDPAIATSVYKKVTDYADKASGRTNS